MTSRASHIYIIGADPSGPVKIGISSNPSKRCRQLQSGCPLSLAVFKSWVIPESALVDACTIESNVHQKLRSDSVWGEWFSVSFDAAERAIVEECRRTLPRGQRATPVNDNSVKILGNRFSTGGARPPPKARKKLPKIETPIGARQRRPTSPALTRRIPAPVDDDLALAGVR